jgi:hypothetical protein
MVRLLRRGLKMDVLGQFTSVFSQTGANMSAGPNALRENRALRESAPAWAQLMRPLFIGQHRLRRLFGGMYSQKPFSYEIFTHSSLPQRQRYNVTSPNGRAP